MMWWALGGIGAVVLLTEVLRPKPVPGFVWHRVSLLSWHRVRVSYDPLLPMPDASSPEENATQRGDDEAREVDLENPYR